MDAIKKKMMSLTTETAIAEERAKKFEQEYQVSSRVADETEEKLKSLQKKLQASEAKYDQCLEDLFNTSIKLEMKEKVTASIEGDVDNLTRRILLVEEELNRSEEKVGITVKNVCLESKRADNTIRNKSGTL